ncbi:Uvi15-like protein [Histoplasma capsulatum]|uniref:Uvi15-like protein n=1 Tax=Ajellomyces capsulatus TaxID=5037 RepID=A0A8A1M263_AJECA|nr:Uvi15-like protein [Histoplasma capsulatum]
MSDKNAPPSYPPPAHQDAGPYAPPQGQYGHPSAAADYYNQPQQYGPPPGQYYPPQQGYPQQGYPQQPMYYAPQPQGHYVDNRDSSRGTGGGICAGILAGLACCCCLDILF